jgi:serine protease
VDLTWSGATSASIDVYRNGALIATTPNDGFHTDSTPNKGRATYTYQVCEAGTATCSNTATVSFGGG